MKLYTKSGDRGETSLIGGERVAKCDLRVEAYGTVDELTAFIALLGDKMNEEQSAQLAAYVEDTHRINSVLMNVEALLAAGEGCDKIKPLEKKYIVWIESRIDDLQSHLKPLTSFTIPGGCTIASLCHICRTICRRAERAALRAAAECNCKCGADSQALIFLNRLSDYFYALGRVVTNLLGCEEVEWRP